MDVSIIRKYFTWFITLFLLNSVLIPLVSVEDTSSSQIDAIPVSLVMITMSAKDNVTLLIINLMPRQQERHHTNKD